MILFSLQKLFGYHYETTLSNTYTRYCVGPSPGAMLEVAADLLLSGHNMLGWGGGRGRSPIPTFL